MNNGTNWVDARELEKELAALQGLTDHELYQALGSALEDRSREIAKRVVVSVTHELAVDEAIRELDSILRVRTGLRALEILGTQ